MELFSEQLELLTLLVRHKVQFLIVGGYAVINYGYERLTSDLDLWIKKNNENRDRLAEALKEYGILDDDLSKLKSIDFSGNVSVISFGKKPRRIEFLTELSLVKFDESYEERSFIDIEGVKIPVIKYEHLILSKMNTERLKDKADIEELQRIRKYKKS
ncbi:MAG: nucleotidyltransferase [Saprospiraceae bacterium]|jgi:predicted nucleotidyltransferase|nr:nucleotidyltransferase [Saprospiraceae bacterium]